MMGFRIWQYRMDLWKLIFRTILNRSKFKDRVVEDSTFYHFSIIEDNEIFALYILASTRKGSIKHNIERLFKSIPSNLKIGNHEIKLLTIITVIDNRLYEELRLKFFNKLLLFKYNQLKMAIRWLNLMDNETLGKLSLVYRFYTDEKFRHRCISLGITEGKIKDLIDEVIEEIFLGAK